MIQYNVAIGCVLARKLPTSCPAVPLRGLGVQNKGMKLSDETNILLKAQPQVIFHSFSPFL